MLHWPNITTQSSQFNFVVQPNRRCNWLLESCWDTSIWVYEKGRETNDFGHLIYHQSDKEQMLCPWSLTANKYNATYHGKKYYDDLQRILSQWEPALNSLLQAFQVKKYTNRNTKSLETQNSWIKQWKGLQKSQTISDLQFINYAKLHHINHNVFFPVYVLLDNGFVFMTVTSVNMCLLMRRLVLLCQFWVAP